MVGLVMAWLERWTRRAITVAAAWGGSVAGACCVPLFPIELRGVDPYYPENAFSDLHPPCSLLGAIAAMAVVAWVSKRGLRALRRTAALACGGAGLALSIATGTLPPTEIDFVHFGMQPRPSFGLTVLGSAVGWVATWHVQCARGTPLRN